jgi:hypothetical protein
VDVSSDEVILNKVRIDFQFLYEYHHQAETQWLPERYFGVF